MYFKTFRGGLKYVGAHVQAICKSNTIVYSWAMSFLWDSLNPVSVTVYS